MSARISLLALLLMLTVISASTRWLGQDPCRSAGRERQSAPG